MDDNNNFLSGYNNRDDEPKKPPRTETSGEVPVKSNKEVPKEVTKEITVKSANPPSFKYEQKSGFKAPERRESAAPVTDDRKKKIIIASAAGGGVLLIIVIVLIALLTGGIPVIDLVGRTQTEAQLWANQNNLNLQATEVFSDDVEAGTIISQETKAGTRVAKNSFVNITVSKGPDLDVTLELPDLMNMTKDEVDAWATENHMTKVRVTTEYSATVAAGKVIRYEINDNTVVGNEVKRDTPVYVIVSKGIDTTVEQVEVPDFKTMTLSECYVFANDHGLTLTVTEQYDDYIAEGSIISQSVKATEKVAKGTEIKLVASKGKKIEIPDFSDYTKEMAQSVATGLGIPVTIVEKYSSASEGSFISQSIPAGTIYEKDDYLELNYSLGNKIVVPSFVGQARDVIEAWALDLNNKGARITISATETNSNQTAGTIIYQSPANTSIGVKKTISITVSKGKVIYMPDFISGASGTYDTAITREQAIEMCEALKIVPVFKEGSKSGVLPGAIWAQSTAAGKEVPEGTKVTLTFAKSKSEGMPDFYGKTQQQALQLGEKKFKIVFAVSATYVDGVPEGYVVSQSVAKNTTTAYGTTVTLYTNPAEDVPVDPEPTGTP
jgi:beta-lactam-binding protein with PASTA domain